MKYLYKLITIVIIIFLSSFSAKAGNESEISQKLPMLHGQSNIGNDYWFAIPPCYEEELAENDNFVKIMVASTERTKVTVEIPGIGYGKEKYTEPNNVIDFQIKPISAQPLTHNGRDFPAPPAQVYKGRGIHVYSESPIIVYVIIRYYHTSDGFLAIPTNTFGTHYINMVYQEPSITLGHLAPFTMITTPYDNTTVSFKMGGGPEGNDGVPLDNGIVLREGNIAKEVMNRGDVWALSIDDHKQDLSGSIIEGDKPFSIVSGMHCANFPIDVYPCDYTVEMELPTHTWGKKYYVTPVHYRSKNGIIRIFAKEDNTTVFRNGEYLTTIDKGGGASPPEGYYETRLWPVKDENENLIPPKPATIEADKPINIMYYNTGAAEDDKVTDPFMMAFTPVEQFQTESLFATPNAAGGADHFQTNYMNIVYEINENGDIPDDILIAELPENGDEPTWEPLSDYLDNEHEIFPTEHKGKRFAWNYTEIPREGMFGLKSQNSLFSATLHGISQWDAYGLPAALGLKDLYAGDSYPPKPEYTQNCDGNVYLDSGTVTDKPDDEGYRSNLADIFLIQEESYNYNLDWRVKDSKFIPGQTVSASWWLTVVDNSQDAKACIYFIDFAGNDTTICLEYNVQEYEFVEDHDFGKIKITGNSATQDFYIRNLSESNDLYISSINLKGSDQGFSIVGTGPDDWVPNDPTMPIPPEEERVVIIEFDPSAAPSDDNDRINLDSLGVGLGYLTNEGTLVECMFNYQVQVRAEVAVPVIEVTDVDFPPRDINEDTWVSKSATIYNIGDASISLTGISKDLTRPEIYQHSFLDEHPNISESQPLILDPNQTIEFTVEFNPNEKGTFQDSIVFESDAGDNIDNVCIINGEGTAPNKVVFENRSNSNYFIFSDSRLRLSNSVISEGFDKLMIYDISGRVLLSENELSNLTIDLNQFNPGVYFIILNGTEKIISEKFEIVR